MIGLLGTGGMNVLSVLFVSTFALTEKIPEEHLVSARITQVNLPAYVEEKSQVQLQVKAEFPTACYQLGPTSVRLDQDRSVVLFHVSAFETRSGCEKNPTLLTAKIDIGRLSEGIYEVRELKSLKKWGKIHVEHFEASADATNNRLALTH